MILACELTEPSASRNTQLFSAFGVSLGAVAILASGTRGAFPVLIGPVVLLIGARGAPLRRRFSVGVWIAGAVIACAAIASAALWSTQLRLTEMVTEVKALTRSGDFSTSTGARVYLVGLGWQIFSESPLIGVGAAERKRRIQSAGLGDDPEIARATEYVRGLGHVHNAYLHHAVDGGLVGLSAFLLTIGGLIALGRSLHEYQPTSAFQLYCVAFVHAFTNLSSVNFAHNYYALMLAISIGVILVKARLMRVDT